MALQMADDDGVGLAIDDLVARVLCRRHTCNGQYSRGPTSYKLSLRQDRAADLLRNRPPVIRVALWLAGQLLGHNF